MIQFYQWQCQRPTLFGTQPKKVILLWSIQNSTGPWLFCTRPAQKALTWASELVSHTVMGHKLHFDGPLVPYPASN